MPVQAITGLPGSGKSCYAMKILYSVFLDWARYEKKHGKPFERKLYTNIPLHVEAINEALTDELGFEVDMTDQIIPLEKEFFVTEKGECREWWLDFEPGSYVIIDEVQELLPAQQGADKKAKALRQSFMVYVSQHRHKQQDLIFMSQHINNVSMDIRRMVAVIFEVINIKDTKFGPFWPYQIPMADIDVVKEAWGLTQQFAHVKRGRKEGNRYVYDKNCEMFLLTPSLFKLYKSHTQSEASSDRPSLELGKIGSLVWLFRRHGIRLIISTVFFVTVAVSGCNTLRAMPNTVMEVITGSVQVQTDDKGKKATPSDGNATAKIPLVPEPLPEKPKEDDKITGLLRGGVITPRGVLRQGDEIVFEGEKDTVSSVDFGKGIVYLGSGKKVHK